MSASLASAQWTWANGDSSINSPGVYGVKGTSSPYDQPGSRGGAMKWTDAGGNLWLFGGELNEYSSSFFSDLWKYNITTNQWAWMKGDSTLNNNTVYGKMGVAAAANKPGARTRGVSWKDAAGNFWLFGGYGYDAYGSTFYLNDLWKYNPSANEWTWVKGGNGTGTVNAVVYGTQGVPADNNIPGLRNMSVSWIDSTNNLWLLGGQGFDSKGNFGMLNDFWKYSITANQWTWVKGDTVRNPTSFYGTQGIASANNKPGGRIKSTGWTDASGDFWLFGGSGFSNGGALNDLWKYSVSANQWTWMKGDSAAFVSGVYGTKGTSSPANKPGARELSVGWADASGNLWLFGGITSESFWNDLWKYNMTLNNWTWVGGDSTANNAGIYGNRETSSATGKPGARSASVSWVSAGNFWLFGGRGCGSARQGQLNDLWKYTPAASILPVILVSFTGKSQEEDNKLEWIAENETNLITYEIERSLNGVDFIPAYQQKANNARRYNFNDNKFGGVNSYYRLKMINKDGSSTYSSVILLKAFSVAKFTIYPNPATSFFKLSFNNYVSGKVNIQIADLNGKVLVTKTFNTEGTVITIPTNKLAGGTYTINVLYNDEQSIQKVVVIK